MNDRPQPVLVQPAQIEQVIDEGNSILGRVQDFERGARHRRRVFLPHQHFRPAVNSGEGISELVVHHREEPLPAAMELLYLLQKPGTLLVVPHVLYRRGSLGRQQDGDVLVLLRKCLGANFLGEIEVPEHAPGAEDRHPQKRVHYGVVGWKPVGVWMLGEIGQPDWLGFADHQPEYAVASGRRP
jgi:hypothetical protein